MNKKCIVPINVTKTTSNYDPLLYKNSTQYLEKLKIEKPQGLMKFP